MQNTKLIVVEGRKLRCRPILEGISRLGDVLVSPYNFRAPIFIGTNAGAIISHDARLAGQGDYFRPLKRKSPPKKKREVNGVKAWGIMMKSGRLMVLAESSKLVAGRLAHYGNKVVPVLITPFPSSGKKGRKK